MFVLRSTMERAVTKAKKDTKEAESASHSLELAGKDDEIDRLKTALGNAQRKIGDMQPFYALGKRRKASQDKANDNRKIKRAAAKDKKPLAKKAPAKKGGRK